MGKIGTTERKFTKTTLKGRGAIMKKLIIGILGAGIVLAAAPEAAAGHHRGHHNEGLHLAAGIINLVKAVFTPAPPVVVAQTPAPVVVAPQPAPVVVTPPAPPVIVRQPAYHHRPAPAPRHHNPPRGGKPHRGHRR